jgi:hypothetical protein
VLVKEHWQEVSYLLKRQDDVEMERRQCSKRAKMKCYEQEVGCHRVACHSQDCILFLCSFSPSIVQAECNIMLIGRFESMN